MSAPASNRPQSPKRAGIAMCNAARQAKVPALSTQGHSLTSDGQTARPQEVITMGNKRKNGRPLHSQTLPLDAVLQTLHHLDSPSGAPKKCFSASCKCYIFYSCQRPWLLR